MGPECRFDDWTDYFKQFDDVIECGIVTTHAPSWTYVLLVLVTFVLGWREFLRKRAREVSRASQAIRAWTTVSQRASVRLALFSALLLAAAYLLARLSDMLWGTFGGRQSMFDGMLKSQIYTTEYQWDLVTGKPYLTYATGWSLAGAALVVILLVYATLTRTAGLRSAVSAMLLAVLMAASAGALMTGIATLGSLTENPPLSTTLPFFYGMWFLGFAFLALGASRILDAGDDLDYALRLNATTVP
ncbi:hypothetical protein ACIBPB_32335 [Micromonospora sp. NPDC049836]|uniref:hypothetical protein n=1 Tax=Micromonospora sp. NPDC049836 TaxID=3364274 RepID=UPI0037B84612